MKRSFPREIYKPDFSPVIFFISIIIIFLAIIGHIQIQHFLACWPKPCVQGGCGHIPQQQPSCPPDIQKQHIQWLLMQLIFNIHIDMCVCVHLWNQRENSETTLQWKNIKQMLLSQYFGWEVAELQQHSLPKRCVILKYKIK